LTTFVSFSSLLWSYVEALAICVPIVVERVGKCDLVVAREHEE
jgi:hypothetical protein